MTAVAKTDTVETIPAAPQSETGALISMIERAARDPAVDVEKMERLFKMHGEMTARAAKVAYIVALAEMQPELPVINEAGKIEVNNQVRSRYARWPDIDEAIKPILHKHGFTLSHRVAQDAQSVSITGVLAHNQGHQEETTIRLPIDTSGSKNAVQAIGSSTSYGQRYTAKLLLKITSRAGEDKDDDGRAAGRGETITEEQEIALRELLESAGANLDRFLKVAKIEKLADLPASEYDRAVKGIKDYAAGKGR